MEKPEKIGVTYLSYKDFISNYNNDFKEWQKHYPDGVEVDYLDFLEDCLCYHMYHSGGSLFPFSKYVKVNEVKIHISDFTFEIERCLEIYMGEEGNLKNEQDVKNTLNSWEIQWALNRGLYGLDYQILKYYTPFLEISNIYEDRYTISFDDVKYKNFEISARRVIEFIETRREQLKNQPAPVVSEEPQPENPKQSKTILINGRTPNLLERYLIADKTLNLEKALYALNVSEKERYKLLALVLGCNETNARLIMTGQYKTKTNEEEIKDFVNKYPFK
ncbi:hypothetical protein [Capnocytophaga canis]|uniref:hypothetical protein n=1 Tax=Capnocytophaga canis TaxID=1848903 RepID=UPI0015620340|nr:hypothetical protein [Capnocytophaga canis]